MQCGNALGEMARVLRPGGGAGKRGKQQPQRKKSKSGNPAKRAADERAAVEKAKAVKTGGGSAFGSGAAGAAPADIDPTQLPAGFEKFLGR